MKNKKAGMLIILGLVLLLLIAFVIGIVYSEMKEAREFCESENKTYTFEYGTHYCDTDKIGKYESFGKGFWNYVKYQNKEFTINLSK